MEVREFVLIFVFGGLCLLIGLVMFLVPVFFAPRDFDDSKVSAYECGFEPFEDARIKFDVQFYFFAILFLIFDIEIIFLLPWVLNVSLAGFDGFVSILVFLFFLILGFIYEWLRGNLSWVRTVIIS